MKPRSLYQAFVRLLPLEFLLLDLGNLRGVGMPPGCDAIIYLRGAAAFLAGGNAWDASLTTESGTYHFAALPTTVQAFVPFTVFSEAAVAYGWMIACAIAAVLIVRRLQMPVTYVLFPPMTLGVYSGNPQIVLLALLLCGAGPLAAFLKIYAVVPMFGERRWRGLAVTGALLCLSFVLAPGLWWTYVQDFWQISARLTIEAHSTISAWGQPALMVVTVVALAIIASTDLRMACWLAIPALWPAAESHYITMALPVVGPLALFLLAIGASWMTSLVVVGYAAVTVAKRVRLASRVAQLAPARWAQSAR